MAEKRHKRKYARREIPASSPPIEKALVSPPVDTMVKVDSNICKGCGRRMTEIRCQCGWVKPINK